MAITNSPVPAMKSANEGARVLAAAPVRPPRLIAWTNTTANVMPSTEVIHRCQKWIQS